TLGGAGTLADPGRPQLHDRVVEVVGDPAELTAVPAPDLSELLGRARLVVDGGVGIQLLAVLRRPVRPRPDRTVVAVEEGVGAATCPLHEIGDFLTLAPHHVLDVGAGPVPAVPTVPAVSVVRSVPAFRPGGGLGLPVSLRVHVSRFPLPSELPGERLGAGTVEVLVTA